MSDTNFMNAYVNLAMETVHSYLNEILQLKTQTKLLNDLVLEKDQVISSLTAELETARANQVDHAGIEAEMNRLRENAANWEFQYNNMSGKVSHMDTLARQYNDLQKELIDKTNQLSELDQLRQRIQEYEQQTSSLNDELVAANKKIDRLSKKEEKEAKKVAPVTSSKSDINKEEPKSIFPTQKINKPVVVEKPKETDDDF